MTGFRSLAAFPPTSTWKLVDDFIKNGGSSLNVGELGWLLSNGSATSVDATSGHPGVVERVSSTTANQISQLRLVTTVTVLPLLFSDFYQMKWTVAAKEVDTDHIVRVGMWQHSSNAPTTGVYIERAAADTSWYGVCNTASSETRVALGAYTASTWYTFAVRRVSETSVLFQVDGVDVATTTTNVPAGSTGMIPLVHITPTTTTARSVYLDRFELVGIERRAL